MGEPNFSGMPASVINQPPVKDKSREKLRETLKQGFYDSMEKIQATSHIQDIVELLGAEQFAIRDQAEEIVGLRLTEFVNAQVEKQLTQRQKPYALPDRIIRLSFPILPTSGESKFETGSGRGMAEKKLVPRTRMLMELLQEMHFEYALLEGATQLNTMRKENYLIFALPEIKTAIWINDEGGNATYVVHHLEEADWEKFAALQKDDLRADSAHQITIVAKPQRADENGEIWKERLRDILTFGPEAKNHVQTHAGLTDVPEGWLDLNQLATLLKIDRTSLESTTNKYKAINPEWFRMALAKNRRMAKLVIAPELIAIARKKYEERGLAPEGWMTINALREKTGAAFKMIDRLAKKHQESNPEWFKEYTSKGLRPRMHLAPELVTLITEKVQAQKNVPAGWMHFGSVTKRLGIFHPEAYQLAKPYRKTHPEWFGFFSKQQKAVEHISPQLFEAIRKDHKSIQNVPDGWLTASEFFKSLGLSKNYKKLYPLLEKYKQNNPEWIRVFRGRNIGIKTDHLSPELVTILEKEFTPRKK